MTVSARTTTPGCAPSWIRSASNTSSPPRPTITPPAASTPRCCVSWPATTQVMAVILPTLGPDRRATYSPILPIHPRTGVVMQVPMASRDPAAGTVVWRDPDSGETFETSVTGGACKLQWKADWAMRWYALDVDYEMSGKDLIDSVRLSGRICRILGSAPPEGFTYELFLDEQAQKISKSKGNGLSVEEWLRYAPPESLGQFMYNQPQRAKRLYFDVIPRAVDEYLGNAARLLTQTGGGTSRQPRLAHPRRPAAQPCRQPGVVRHAAEPGQRGERRDAGHAVGLHPPLQSRRQPRNDAVPRPAGRPRHRLLPRLRPPGKALPPSHRDRARRAGRPRRDPARHGPCNHAGRRHAGRASPGRRRPRARPWRRPEAAPGAEPKRSRTSSTRSASATPSPSCAPGSAASIRCCSASRRARASAASSRCTASPRRSR